VQLLLRESNGCEQPIPPSAGLAQNVPWSKYNDEIAYFGGLVDGV
jgi:hypothetical protein